MEKYKVQSIDEVTTELINALVERYKIKEVPRLKRLKNYYLGKSNIKNRVMNDPSKPNEKIANNFAGYITDTVSGYFMGKAISYSSENEEYMSKLQLIFDQNHEQTHNTRMSKNLSIFGVAYELLFVNEKNEVKFSVLDPRETFMIYENSIDEKPLAGVRFFEIEDYTSDNTITQIEVYTSNMIQTYQRSEEDLELVDEKPHYFKDVNILCYENNFDGVGDWEKQIDLIDAYDLAISDSLNGLQYFSDCYLVLTNVDNLNEEDIALMKERRVISMPENATVQWLEKGTGNLDLENIKERLKEDIHGFSQVPDINDKNFNQTISGEALKYKIFSLENLCSIKESQYREGLEKRIELITNILNVKGFSFVPTDVKMQFTRNLPTNMQMLADMITKLHGIVSQESLLSLLPFINSVSKEKALIEKEKESSMYGDFGVNDQIVTSIEANTTSADTFNIV